MNNLSLVQRAELYSKAFPKYPPLRADKRWLDGMWLLGNNYKGSGYYGAYPPQYIRRIMALFPDANRILHLFSGSLPPSEHYTRFDLKGGDVTGDAEQLSSYFKPASFELILADPPYSAEDSEHYGVPLISRNKVLKEAQSILCPSGYIVWLDQVLPMFRKTELSLVGVIGVIRSTNHRFRVVCIFQAKNQQP